MGGLPRRWNPVEIIIRQRVPTSEATLDPDFGEPAGPRRYKGGQCSTGGLLTLCGQVNFGSKKWDEIFPSQAGDRSESRGHLLFKVRDLEMRGVTLQKGDIIVKIAGKTFDLRIIQLRYQNPLRGMFMFLVAEFERNIHTRGSVQ